jgi:hypothetical protein
MFMKFDREAMKRALRAGQRALCGYDAFSMYHNCTCEPTTFCDCKYGAEFKGESNGCPEMRVLCVMFEMMTDKEFERIAKRVEKARKNK